jgi:hypothetical protein
MVQRMDADDPIPVDAIGLVEAYQLTRSAHIPDWDRLANGMTSDNDDPWWSVPGFNNQWNAPPGICDQEGI